MLFLQSLAETPGRICLHEGSLLELDPIEGTPLKRIHAYLFNDVLMVASWLANGGRRGPPRYKMQAVYNLESLAIVNVRDHGTVKLAFKLLAFSDTRVFQCATATSKVSAFECGHQSVQHEAGLLKLLYSCRKSGWINVSRRRDQNWPEKIRLMLQMRIRTQRKRK